VTQLRVAVVGGAGYAGGELLRLLLQHPHVRECVATSRSQAGKPIAEAHPTLAPLTEARFSGATPGEIARGMDVVFLALEHGESSRLAEEVFEAGPGLVIDLAADFRVQAPRLYERFYGVHPSPEFVSRFVYGLADVAGQSLRGATAIASPGCFATAAQLALFPLANLPLAAAPSLFAITGSSGAGVHPRPTTHHPARANNVFAYSVTGHRHEAEVLQAWRAWTGSPEASARLMVHAGPFVRGIYLTLHAELANGAAPGTGAAGLEGGDVMGRYRSAYEGRAFVRLLDQAPELTHAVGTNYALLHAAMSDDGRHIQVMVALDNLIKGAGGQAIQAMNLALGLPEPSGLTAVGVFPC
jgi:N-acetyl-gamma-glutamyl-phosphate reductase common form